ncbi:MAG: hypothetical protein CMF49_06155 [Legionellales bacterium]|nr:hypothetical protein [Legionellales bacterium]|tara:strand:+ start:194 stop:466 length:273 start_codon:yes stop_codon:yes gene_type:complete
MKDLKFLTSSATLIGMCVAGLFWIFTIKGDAAITLNKVDALNMRINRLEQRQIHLNDKQDAELQKYWDNLELRIGEMQKIQFEQRCENRG